MVKRSPDRPDALQAMAAKLAVLCVEYANIMAPIAGESQEIADAEKALHRAARLVTELGVGLRVKAQRNEAPLPLFDGAKPAPIITALGLPRKSEPAPMSEAIDRVVEKTKRIRDKPRKPADASRSS